MAATTIWLWAHPRSRSTLVERFFLSHPDVHVSHEPLTDCHFFGPEHVCVRYSNEECKKGWPHLADITFEGQWKEATTPIQGKKLCFVKDTSCFLPDVYAETARKPPEEGNPTLIPKKLLLDPNIQHIFLIRPLEEAFSSYEKINANPVIGDGFFNPKKLCVRELRRLFEYISHETPEDQPGPIVIHSDDVLNHKEKVIAWLCELGKIEYSRSMLSWEAKATNAEEAFGIRWKGWHEDALNSTGIIRASRRAEIKLSAEVRTAVEENKEDWEWLAARARRFG